MTSAANKKIRPNEPCWCGSGKKFKKCHALNPEPDVRFAVDLAKGHIKSFRHEMCLAPKSKKNVCSGKIVSAHTVPRSYLARVARDGHVYRIAWDVLFKREEFPVHAKLIGINQASTMTGFCAYHDDSLFAPLEKHPFVASDEQCFLVMYRSVARELFQKIGASKSIERRQNLMFERRAQIEPSKRDVIEGYELGTRKGLSDIQGHMLLLQGQLENQSFAELRHYVIEFDSTIDVLCSGAFFPESDFAGAYLRNRDRLGDLSGQAPHLIGFSTIVEDGVGFVVFCWQPESDETCLPFIHSLAAIPDELVGDALLRMFYEFCENTYCSPVWWEHLSEMDRTHLLIRFATGGSPFHGRKETCLLDDELRLTKWNVVRRVLRAD